MLLKAIKFIAAAMAAAIGSLGYFYYLDYPQFSLMYRCWQSATNISACYSDKSFDFTAEINGFRYEGNTGNVVDKSVFFYGAFEKPVLYFLRDIMTSAYSGQGVFLDIGANTGQHSLFISRHAREIHAFEPWAPVLKRLRRHIELNRLNNIVVHPF